MKTLIALVAVVASVSAASANGVSQNDINRYVTPNQIAQLSAEEVRAVHGLITTGGTRLEIRNKIEALLN